VKRDFSIGFALVVFVGIATGSFCQSSKSNAHVWKMKKVDVTTQVNDLHRQGASLQVHGLSMLVPMDWSFEGMATIPPKLDCAFTMGRFNLRTQSLDKSSGLEVFAQTTSFWSDNRMALQQVEQQNQRPYSAIDCKVEQPSTVAEGLPKIISRFIADGHAVGAVQPVPGLSERLGAEVQQANQQLGGRSRLAADAGRLRVNGTIAGKPIEAWIVALHSVRTDPAPGGGSNELSDIPLFAVMYAPRGQLDGQEKMFSAMLDSIQIDPQWTSYIAQFVEQLAQIRQRAMNQVAQIYANMAADNANAAAQQQQIRNGVNDYRNKVYSNVANDRAAALDHSSQQFALHMGDQAIYTDPSTGQHVQMSNQYGHAWASTTGNTNEYILTDSSSFNPNGQVGSGSWAQMQPEH
jgi:hypothetical protein